MAQQERVELWQLPVSCLENGVAVCPYKDCGHQNTVSESGRSTCQKCQKEFHVIADSGYSKHYTSE